jgi:hypothetical protein
MLADRKFRFALILFAWGAFVCPWAFGAPVLGTSTGVESPWDAGSDDDEMNLYEIYNALYGTGFTSADGLAADGGMEELQISGSSFFELFGTADVTVRFVAMFSDSSQRFGYYTSPGSTSLTGNPNAAAASGTLTDGDFHHLFDVSDFGFAPDAHGGAIALGDSPAGFYLNSPLGGGITWFSQSSRNIDFGEHMVAYLVSDAGGNIDPNRLFIAFEDIYNLGERDYNDLVFELIFTPDDEGPTNPENPVPEPGTLLLVAGGLAGLGLRVRLGR